MKTLNLECPINNLSFGDVSFNIAYELYKKGISCNLFPIGQPDFTAFDQMPQEFKNWLEESMFKSLKDYKRTDPSLKIWHISGSQNRISDKQFLFTFHEVNALTEQEINLLNNQNGVFVACHYNKNIFEKFGVNNVTSVGLGFDNLHFKRIEKRLIPKDVIGIGLFGKFENSRKATGKVLSILAKLYGDNNKYAIHCSIINPFMKEEQNDQLIGQALEGKRYHNFNFLNYVQTRSEYSKILNSVDLVVDASRSESWSIPSFTAACLGKFPVLHNCAGISDWAEHSGGELFESTGMVDCYDNIFFSKGAPFNQGQFFDWDEVDLIDALKRAEKKYLENKINHQGIEMSHIFTWEKTVEKILEKIF